MTECVADDLLEVDRLYIKDLSNIVLGIHVYC